MLRLIRAQWQNYVNFRPGRQFGDSYRALVNCLFYENPFFCPPLFCHPTELFTTSYNFCCPLAPASGVSRLLPHCCGLVTNVMDPILAEMCSIFRPFKHLKKSKKINIIHFLFIFVLWSFFFRNFWPSHILNAYQVIFGISYPSDPIKATSALSNSGNPHVPHPLRREKTLKQWDC